MKVEFIKNHVLGAKGEVADLSQPKANYLIRCNVAKVYKPKRKAKKKEAETE